MKGYFSGRISQETPLEVFFKELPGKYMSGNSPSIICQGPHHERSVRKLTRDNL